MHSDDTCYLSTFTMATTAQPVITILKRRRADAPFAQTKFYKKTAKGKVMNSELDLDEDDD
jgi:hypothetical protein